MRRLLLTAVAAVWLAAGGYGFYAYVAGYSSYRGFAPPRDPPGVAGGSVERQTFFSPALSAWRSYLVYLPPGYETAVRHRVRFPALYLLHPPPGRPEDYVGAGASAVRLDELIHRRAVRPFLLVLPFGRSQRFHDDTEWANAGAGRYEDFVLDTVRAVDRRWATQRDRAGRAIAGLSEGGYGAVNIALHHLELFSVAESWSGYFDQTRTAAFARASPTLLRANSPEAYVGRFARALRRLPLHAFIYQGDRRRITQAAINSARQACLQVGPAQVSADGEKGEYWHIPHLPAAVRRAGARPLPLSLDLGHVGLPGRSPDRV